MVLAAAGKSENAEHKKKQTHETLSHSHIVYADLINVRTETHLKRDQFSTVALSLEH